MELDNGPLAGLSLEETSRKYPLTDFLGPFDPLVVNANTGESGWSLHASAIRALERVIRRGSGSYLVVSHGNALNAALRCVVGAQPPVRGQGLGFSLGDTGFVRARCKSDRDQWTIAELGPGE